MYVGGKERVWVKNISEFGKFNNGKTACRERFKKARKTRKFCYGIAKREPCTDMKINVLGNSVVITAAESQIEN